jgi:hypothetical protein
LGILFDALALLVIGVIFLGILMHYKICDAGDWASICAAFVVAVVVIFFSRRATLREAMLVEVTMSYLIHGDKSLLDDLLGKLIGGRPLRQIKLGDTLFDVLEKLVVGQDWEMRRLIAEALPALSEIHTERAMSVATMLREDWEPTKWKTDVRRRVVEALILPSQPGRTPLINRVKPKKVIQLLQLREKDQIYVAMAIAEAIHEWKDTRPKIANPLKDELLQFAVKLFPYDQYQAICDTFDLLQASKSSNILIPLEKLEQMSNSTNTFVQIAASRNVLLVSGRFPDKTLDLMLGFLEPSRHHNIRRPIAKEQSVDFLIKMLGNRTYQTKAEETLWRLFSDTEEIIRIATFDRAERLKDKDQALLLKVCDHILANETSQILLERARRMKRELSGRE